MKTRIGILGYGNLGKGIEYAVSETEDMELAAVFTRRDPSTVTPVTKDVPVVSVADIKDWTDKIDVLMICGGSATDLPVQTPEYAKYFNVIDSFDTHHNIPVHFANVDASGPVPMRVPSCRTERITPSGAEAFRRDTPMRSAASKVLPTRSSILFRVKMRLRQ